MKTINEKQKFDVFKLKGKLGNIRDWMSSHHFPPKVLFFLLGIISTIWFLIRVIPKPSRATYPCMRVAAPFMSGMVTYLLAVGGLTAISRKFNLKIIKVRYTSTALLVFAVIAAMAVTPSISTFISEQSNTDRPGPEDGPNQPFGKAQGIFPGRVVWVWDQNATNENFKTNFDTYDWFWKPENTNEKVVGTMFQNGLKKVTGKKKISDSWDALFHTFNVKKLQKDKGYTKGEKVYIKINQGQSRWVLLQEDKDKGYYIPKTLKPSEEKRKESMIPTETGPYVVLEVLRELVNEVGVNQEDIAVGDPMCPIWGHNFDVWHNEFPNVKYIDKVSTNFNRTLIKNTETEVLFYSDKTTKDKLYDVAVNADYMINCAVMKPHGAAGISLTAKNHFGDTGRATAGHLHYSHVANGREGYPTNTGYHKYRVLVDLMGSKYLGQNTVLYVIEALFGGGASEIKGPVKYFMAPFNNDWTNSVFLSQDNVAIQSVGFDILRTEWNGINKHDPTNNDWEAMPNALGVDDFLHQAADPNNWPAGIQYDPDNSGKPITSLGVHEHWNNSKDMQYSRNLGKKDGIELVTIPETLVKTSK
jgi:hypothetical protein